ncbi:acetyltransferase [Ectothiorhodospiraceae bacterium 2226]|nr:acetyltransferase [Ectothiorhodospiraceae bacterium 2226]
MSKLHILGAGGHGKVVADAALAAGMADEIVFYDDRFPTLTTVGAWPVVGRLEDVPEGGRDLAVVALGDNALRMRIIQQLAERDASLARVVHPSAAISRSATLGEGSVVLAQAVVGPDAELGRGCIVNSGATVDHDCRLGEGVHVAPGAHLGGAVVVGRETWIGLGASVIEGLRIGERCLVAAGAAVVHDLPDQSRVGGVPAKALGSAGATGE